MKQLDELLPKLKENGSRVLLFRCVCVYVCVCRGEGLTLNQSRNETVARQGELQLHKRVGGGA